jgi:hypothetical protein
VPIFGRFLADFWPIFWPIWTDFESYFDSILSLIMGQFWADCRPISDQFLADIGANFERFQV